MPEILSVNSNNNTLKKMWRSFSSLDRFWQLSFIAMFIILVTTPLITASRFDTRQHAATSLLVVYDNGVAPGFTDSSYSYSTQNLCDTSNFVSSPCSYSISYNGWGSMRFLATTPLDTSSYATFEWNTKTGSYPISDYSVLLTDSSNTIIKQLTLTSSNVTQTLSNGWVHVSVPLALINPNNTPVASVEIKNQTSGSMSTIYVDDVQFVGTSSTTTPTPTPSILPTLTPGGTGGISGLHVQGNHILNSLNQPVFIHGANFSGSEYACIQGWGFFDGPSDLTMIQNMKKWGINAVRIPLNEDCWLNINGAPSTYSGTNYQNAIANYVSLLLQEQMIPILELHWTAPGTTKATGQQPMLDADHSLTFWQQVATAYKGYSQVIFEPHNEPYPDNNGDTTAAWQCWRDGGTCSGISYQAAGMQSVVNTIRQTGAKNVILLGGVQYSNALSQWLGFKPTDSLNNLAAAWHVYNFNVCNNTSCYDTKVAPVASQVPVVATEIGSNTCDTTFMNTVMNWLESKHQSYLAWTWDTWGTACSNISLISNFDGTATQYGNIYKTHVANLLLTPTPTSGVPTPTPIVTSVPTPISYQSPTPTPITDSLPPSVSITSPQNGSIVAKHTSVTLAATATDNVKVAQVEFSVNNSVQCTVSVSPYQCRWRVPNQRNATFTIQAKATDTAGNSATSLITVTSN